MTSQKLVGRSNHWAMGISYGEQVTGLVHFSPVYLRDVKSCDSPKKTCHLLTIRVAHGSVVRASYWHLGIVGSIPAGGSDFFPSISMLYLILNSSFITLEWLLFYILLIKIMQLGLFNYGKFWDSPRHRVLIEYYCLKIQKAWNSKIERHTQESPTFHLNDHKETVKMNLNP